MGKKINAMLGAVAGLAAIGSAHATEQTAAPAQPSLQASSYADLLMPIANASTLLRIDDQMRSAADDRMSGVKLAEEHHHHHHATVIIKHRRHHHHHVRKIIIKKPRHHHHHHHHHHSYFNAGPSKADA